MTRSNRALAMATAAVTAWSAYWYAPDTTIRAALILLLLAGSGLWAWLLWHPTRNEWDRLAERDRRRARAMHPTNRDELP